MRIRNAVPLPFLAVVLFAVSGFGAETAPIPGQKVFICGHSFHVYIGKLLEEITKSAGIENHVNAGVQYIGGSSVTQHWETPDESNKVKKALSTGTIDVLTLSPNWTMPDPAIDKFVNLALEKNPKTRIVIQASWLAFDSAQKNNGIKDNSERDGKTVEELTAIMETLRPIFEKQINDINARVGHPVLFIAPVGRCVLALRDKVIRDEAPGIKKQSDLFMDSIGHGKDEIQHLAAYCFFATIYHRSPVGLKVFEKDGNEKWNKLNRLLQEIAWETVTKYPLSGVKADEPAAK